MAAQTAKDKAAFQILTPKATRKLQGTGGFRIQQDVPHPRAYGTFKISNGRAARVCQIEDSSRSRQLHDKLVNDWSIWRERGWRK
jgi:hypothetical protein